MADTTTPAGERPVYESPFCDGPNAHPERDDTAHLPVQGPARFDRRPQSVTAMRYVRRDLDAVLDFVRDSDRYDVDLVSTTCFGGIRVASAVRGGKSLVVDPGDWVLWLPDGTFRVLSDQEFREDYEGVGGA